MIKNRLAWYQEPSGLEHFGAPTCIVGGAAVIGSGEEGYQMALRKALKAVHHTLVRSHDHLQSIHLCSTGEDLLKNKHELNL